MGADLDLVAGSGDGMPGAMKRVTNLDAFLHKMEGFGDRVISCEPDDPDDENADLDDESDDIADIDTDHHRYHHTGSYGNDGDTWDELNPGFVN